MIEKLEIKTVPVPNNSALVKNVGMDNESLFDKINELIDVVNALQKDYENVCVWVGEQKLKTPAENVQPDAESRPVNVQDKFAEQRKWIGKLCEFWDFESETPRYFGILTRIEKTAKVKYEAHNGFWYCNCEPVKPDDDIIYKGGDNE